MPIYTYQCSSCGTQTDHLTSYLARDAEWFGCEKCGLRTERVKVQGWTMGKPAYQMQAVLGSGAHVKGHFGKDAARSKKGS